MTIGELIKTTRIEKSYSIEKISKTLNIKEKYLIAIEEDNLECFDSHAYYLGYLKQYLKILKLEIDIKSQFNQKLEINIPSSDKINPSFSLSLLAIICCILIYVMFDSLLSKNSDKLMHLETNQKH